MLHALQMLSGIVAISTSPPVPVPLPTTPRPLPNVIVATPPPTATPLPTAQPANVFVPAVPSGPPQDASAIVARISSSKRTYGIKEPVMLRLSLKNSGDRPYTRPWLYPWFITRLVIVDQNGMQLEAVGHDTHSATMLREHNHPGVLQPRESMDLSWDGKTEFPLSYWDVTLPQGRYTIRVIPLVENAYSTVDHSIRSNSISIRVR